MKKKKGTRPDKADSVRMALAMTGVTCTKQAVELILEVLDTVDNLGGKFSLMDASRIRIKYDNKYEKDEASLRMTQEGFVREMRKLVDDLTKLKERDENIKL